jgi:hypothetical protein
MIALSTVTEQAEASARSGSTPAACLLAAWCVQQRSVRKWSAQSRAERLY